MFELTTLDTIIILLIIASFIFFVMEMIVAGFGFFGIMGTIFSVVAIGLTIIFDRSFIFIFTGISLIFYFVGVIAFIFVKNKDKGIINNEVVAKEEIKDLSVYINKEGVSKTVLKPIGTIFIENEELEAIASLSFIDKGEKVRVVRVTDGKIIVEKV